MISFVFLASRRSTLGGLALATLVLLSGCGGSGSSVESISTPTADYTIAVAPASLQVTTEGGVQTCTVSITAVYGFTSTVNVSFGALPAGVTVSPSTFALTPPTVTGGSGNSQAVTVTVAASALASKLTVTLQSSSGSLSHSAQLSLNIVAVTAASGQHAPIRTQYRRTNAAYQLLDNLPLPYSVYDSAHRQFFICDPSLNKVDVFNAITQTETTQIAVPFPYSIDISPLNGNLYVTSFWGDIYQFNTSTYALIQRFPGATIGPNGYSPTAAFVLSDGRLALLGGQAGIVGVDGASGAAVWDPVSNSLDTGASGSICPGMNIGPFGVTADRTRVLAASIDSAVEICSYDPVARQAITGGGGASSFVRQFIPIPGGTRFFLATNLLGVQMYDAKTLQLLGQILPTNTSPTLALLPNAPAGAVLSLDGKTLYLVDENTGEVQAFDTASFKQTGWLPSFTVADSQSVVSLGAIDETGLIVGPVGHGVGFLDATQIKTTQPSLMGAAFPSPSTGPLTGGTVLIDFATVLPSYTANLNQIYVGNAAGFAASFPSPAQVSTPPSSQAGPVDLTVLVSDGGVAIDPDGFSYGPSILEVVPNGATADGSQLGAIIGYGFGQSPSSVQVTVGGKPAPVTALEPGPPVDPYPLPVDTLQFTIPPGTAGTAVDVTVTTPSGSATAQAVFHYTSAVETYPLAAKLQAGIYDSQRDLYYFTDQSKIQVLSRTSGKWLAPITLPNVLSTTQLLGLAESPDHTKLAVADYGGQAIYVLNPDNPAGAQRFAMPFGSNGAPGIAMEIPAGLAITNAGFVYFGGSLNIEELVTAIHKLNTSTGAITNLGPREVGGQDQYVRVLLSPDGSRIYTCVEGESYWLNTSDDQVSPSLNTLGAGGDIPEIALSGDGITVSENGYFTDESLNPENTPAYIDWETWLPAAAIGEKLSQDGSILFQPLTDGIDLIARNTGRLLYRIQLPFAVPIVYDALVVVPGQNTLAVITASGVSFANFTSLPIAQSLTQPYPNILHPTNSAPRRLAPQFDNRPRLKRASPSNKTSRDAGPQKRNKPENRD